jgi:hypothetical protein
LAVLGIKVAASTVRKILNEAGIDPLPGRDRLTWPAFLRSQRTRSSPPTSSKSGP